MDHYSKNADSCNAQDRMDKNVLADESFTNNNK